MPSVEELLNSDEQDEQIETYAEENEELVIDAETRVINIPESEVLFGVKGDKNIERKYFRCPKIVGDNVDLSKHLIYIAYVYSENTGSIFPTVGIQPYHCDDVKIDGDDITFSWKLSENVFQSAGFIVFKMYAKEKEDSPYTVFNTAPAIGTVLYTIGDGVDSVVSEYPDIINQLLAEIESVQEIATPEAMQGYVNDYFEENPPSGVEVDTTLTQSGKAADAKVTGDELAKRLVAPTEDGTEGQVLSKDVDGNSVWKTPAVTEKGIQVSEYVQGGTWYFSDINTALEDGNLRMRNSGDVSESLTSDFRYKHFKLKIPANNVTFSTKCHPTYSESTSDPFYPPVMVSDDEGVTWTALECEFVTVSGTMYQAIAQIEGKKGWLVNINMYRGGSSSDPLWPGISGISEYVYYSIPEFYDSYTITLPEYNDKFIPTIDDDLPSEYTTYSSKKIWEFIVGGKSDRPSSGTEHFKVIINKYDLSMNTGAETIQDGETEYEDNCVIFLPTSYSASGEPTRLVISCHGSGTIINDSFSLDSKSWNYFLCQMGYAILDVNGGAEDSRHFGAPWAIQSYIKAYQYVINKYNLYTDVFVLGSSMGGLPAFTLSQCGTVPIKALAGFCPVVDLYRQAWMNPWYAGTSGEAWGTQRKLIAEYYNFDNYNTFSGWTDAKTPSETEMQYFLDNAEKWEGYNPMTCGAANGSIVLTTETTNYASLYENLIKLHKVPVKIWQSDVDTTVPAEFGKYIVQAIKKAGGIAYHRSYPTGGHTPGWGGTVQVQSPQGLVLTPYTNEYECYLWLKRWQ